MEDNSTFAGGLSTDEALKRLYDDVQKEADKFKKDIKDSLRAIHFKGTWVYDAFHHKSPYSTFRWPSILLLLTLTIILIVCYSVADNIRVNVLIWDVFIILCLIAFNGMITAWDKYQRNNEMYQVLIQNLNTLKAIVRENNWVPENYSHLNMPYSPCITVQWAYRDGKLVNLHWPLLVRGDVILLKPGTTVLCRCVPYGEPGLELYFGDIFGPLVSGQREAVSTPKARQPLKAKKFVLLETPLVFNIRQCLKKSKKRPLSVFETERHIVAKHWIEKIAIPIVFFISLGMNCFRYVYLRQSSGHWTEMILLLQANALLPLLPLNFTLYWMLVNSYGLSRLLSLFQMPKQAKVELDPFDEVSEPSLLPRTELTWKIVLSNWRNVLMGYVPNLPRTANLLHALGSVSALCCVDKKGILSWPNPTAEKVFFLRSPCKIDRAGSISNRSAKTTFYPPDPDAVQSNSRGNDTPGNTDDVKITVGEVNYSTYRESITEVLDLTHDSSLPFRLQFDDPNWKNHFASLKPLGMGILLNTCNKNTYEHYNQFASHILCESLLNDDTVPTVVNRRCLCEVARQIGFKHETATEHLQIVGQYSSFRPLLPDHAHKDRLVKSLSFTKLKFPFPHVVAVGHKDKHTGMQQLISQGTADIVTDLCSDYWDGEDLRLLTEMDRKKIIDFYHRSSLTAYCTAFAYSPMDAPVSSKFADIYMELPEDLDHFYHRNTPFYPSSPRSYSGEHTQTVEKNRLKSMFVSTDSLFYGDHNITTEPITDVLSCLEAQSSQIFLGMVTFQYQVKADIVQLIEQLESACIRFVHFSKENELRSRVFSEKIGLESGWNCHISLLSERSKSSSNSLSTQPHNSLKASRTNLLGKPTSIDNILLDGYCRTSSVKYKTFGGSRLLSCSAPSAINLDMSTVKFEDDVSLYNVSPTNTDCYSSNGSHDNEQKTNTSRTRSGSLYPPRHLAMNYLDESNDDMEDGSMLVHGRSVEIDKVSSDFPGGRVERSPSRATESTDQSAPIGFDMSNRAKLPKGIDKIRPHLEQVDNVPLLVSLFTDCTPEATREMIQIMQEYGEVVCVIGSAANCLNNNIFLQADMSIAVEPLYPTICQREVVNLKTRSSSNNQLNITPVELAHKLNSLSCSLTINRQDIVEISNLILEGRHYTLSLRTSAQFYVSCCLSLSSIQIISFVLLYPPIISTSQLLWLLCVIIPLLSVGLMGSPTDSRLMKTATTKNVQVMKKSVIVNFVICSGVKFIPSLLVCLLCFGLILESFCKSLFPDKPETHCSVLIVFQDRLSNESSFSGWNGWGDQYAFSLAVCQNFFAVQLVVFLVCISVNFVRRMDPVYSKLPFTNRLWCATTPIVLFLQLAYVLLDDVITRSIYQQSENDQSLANIPITVWMIFAIWPLGAIFINELVKKHEIDAEERFQKKARLEFGTKLGMNSPF